MQTFNKIPDWDCFSENLRNKLGYSDATMERTKRTYTDFVRNYCTLEGGDAETVVIQGILKAGNAYEANDISKDKLVRIRRLEKPVEFLTALRYYREGRCKGDGDERNH